MDKRNIETGDLISNDGYADQPYMLTAEDNALVVVITKGAGEEGERGQHVESMRSFDMGKTWGDLCEVESSENPESSYAVLYKTKFGRIYCFYNYNADNTREVICDTPEKFCKRVDSQGHFVFKYSDDNAKSWSKKYYDIPQKKFYCDITNPYKGDILYFWNVGKPFTIKEELFVPLYKFNHLTETFMDLSEGVLLNCKNIESEKDPEKLVWQTLPEGDTGIRLPHYVSHVNEEHSFVVLSDNSVFCVFRTTTGNSYCTYSRDFCKSFEAAKKMIYHDGREIKHPRAANFIWKCQNGKYLYWYHNNGGHSYDGRNPVFLAGAVEENSKNGKILKFSQPEIILYSKNKNDRMSYPDLLEKNGKYYISETQKTIARIHEIDNVLLEGLWEQFENPTYSKRKNILDENKKIPQINLKNQSITIFIEFEEDNDQILLLETDEKNIGIKIYLKNRKIVMELKDINQNTAYAESDTLGLTKKHSTAIIIDSDIGLIEFVTDAIFNDGMDERRYGYTWFDKKIEEISTNSIVKVSDNVNNIEIFDGAIKISEAISITKNKKLCK